MEFIRGVYNIQAKHKQCVLTIGNFDGVHLGHQAILHRVKELADKYKVPSCIMIFEPQPREFFLAEKSPGRISRLRDKLTLLQKYGIDNVLCVPFNENLQKLTAEEFCSSILLEGLNIKHLVVGDDFRFGCDRQGNFSYLHEFGLDKGFIVENTPSIVSTESTRISSSLVRDALIDGNIEQAEALLGHEVVLSGRVIHGQKLGRTLGFPTANIHLKNASLAISGVFAVKLKVKNRLYNGVANVGYRPTVNGKVPILEVHLFEFNGSLYDEYVDVYFYHFIRQEKKMSGLPELEKQIQRDKEEAVRFFLHE